MLKNNSKANDALIMLCYTCAFGAFGAFFRWLQMQVARDTETGMINPSILNILLPLLIVAAAVVLWLRTRKLTDDQIVFPTGMSEALRGLSILYIIFAWIIAALAVLGGVLTIAETSLDSLRTMYVLVAVLGMLSGLSFPLICSASRSHYSPSLVSIFMALPILMYCVWLPVKRKQPQRLDVRDRDPRYLLRDTCAVLCRRLRFRQTRSAQGLLSEPLGRIHVHNNAGRQPPYGT